MMFSEQNFSINEPAKISPKAGCVKKANKNNMLCNFQQTGTLLDSLIGQELAAWSQTRSDRKLNRPHQREAPTPAS
tara:strand:- start:1124 stop:1351 length:228 start_codon:yes stop_codon:yes gene_type:complete